MRITLIAVLVVNFMVSCGTTPIETPRAEVTLVRKTDYGSITLKSVGYGKNREEAIEDAQKNALYVILFRGIPESDNNYPLVSNENEAKEANRNYFNNFETGELYKSFITDVTESSNLIKLKGKCKIYVDLSINYLALRKDLEQNSVIRKFGY